MKFSLLREADKFVAPATGTSGDWLVKLPDPMFPDLPSNEFATMSLAKRVGIDVPNVQLVSPSEVEGVPEWLWHLEQRAFAVERFDREADYRIHIEDLAQVRGCPVRDRYRGNFETVAAMIWRQVHDSDLLEFARRLTFNLLVGNDDAHLKNWSLIYRDGKTARLSPAYDLISVEPYGSVGLDRGTGLRLANSRRYDDLTLGAFTRLGRAIGYLESDLAKVARTMTLRVQDAWSDYLAALPDSLDADRVDAHMRRVASRLTS